MNPATGRAWSPSDPGFVERFGTRDPTTGAYYNPITGQYYDPVTGRWSSSPIGPLDGGTDVPPAPGVPGSSAVQPADRGNQPLNDGVASPGGDGIALSPGGTPGTLAPGGTQYVPPTVEPQGSTGGDFQVSPERLEVSARRWEDLSARISELNKRVAGLPESIKFGRVDAPSVAYGSAQGTAHEQGDIGGDLIL